MNPPVPTALRVLRGNPGHRPLPANEPTPELGAEMPEDLSDGAKKHWPELAAMLQSAGVLTRMDQLALAMLCESWSAWRDATNKVKKYGPLIKSPKTGIPMLSPYYIVMHRSHEQVRSLLAEFGMTPSSRTRVQAAPQPKPRSRLFEALNDSET